MSARSGHLGFRRNSNGSRLLKTGVAHHKAGQREQAEAVYRKVLRKAPRNADALHLLGIIALDRGQPQRAIELIERALAITPVFPAAHLTFGNALRVVGRFDEGEASYRRAIELQPDFAQAHSNLASLLIGRELFDEALESATRAAELMPKLIEAHFNRALALFHRRRFAEAEAAYRKVLAAEPENVLTLSALGAVLTELKRFDEAIESHRQAIALQPENGQLHFRLAETLRTSGDPHASEASSRHGLALKAEVAKPWAGLGLTLRMLGRFDEARSCFERALKLDPELPEGHAGLAIIGQQLGREGHIEQLRALLAEPDRSVTSRIWLGFALGRMLDNADRYDEAFPYFAEANTLLRQKLADFGRGLRSRGAAGSGEPRHPIVHASPLFDGRTGRGSIGAAGLCCRHAALGHQPRRANRRQPFARHRCRGTRRYRHDLPDGV